MLLSQLLQDLVSFIPGRVVVEGDGRGFVKLEADIRHTRRVTES